jgi:hypothetical protein
MTSVVDRRRFLLSSLAGANERSTAFIRAFDELPSLSIRCDEIGQVRILLDSWVGGALHPKQAVGWDARD